MNRPDDRPIRLIALDCETTGLDLAAGNVPIEVGAAFRDDSGNVQWFETRILHEAGSFTWHPEAFKVNHFSLEEISDPRVANPAEIVDADLAVWLDAAGDYRLVPLGWNVGSFDWPFILKWLPITASLFKDRYGNPGHQFADLNSMMFLLEKAQQGMGSHPTKASLRGVAEKAADRDGMEVRWHSGGFDSYASLIAFEELARWVEQ